MINLQYMLIKLKIIWFILLINYKKFSNIKCITFKICVYHNYKINLLNTKKRNSKLLDVLQREGIGGSP